MSLSSSKKYKFDLLDRAALAAEKGENNVPGYDKYLESQEAALKAEWIEKGGDASMFKGFKPSAGPEAFSHASGPFEVTPGLAQVRIVHSAGLIMDGGNPCQASISWQNIVNSIPSQEMKAQLAKLSAMQTLPASVKITAATVGDNVAYRNMCHLKVSDGSVPFSKTMNTPHLYKRGDGTCKAVGYPLHLLTEEGGYVLEEPPQLTNQFAQYWYISNSMLTSCAYEQKSQKGTYVSIPKNSDAARLMYFVLVIKNGCGAPPGDNVTGMDSAIFTQSFRDNNDQDNWRFPQHVFEDVSNLLAGKLQDVQDKSFNCETMYIDVEAFDVFKETIFKGKPPMPILVTLEIDLHLPQMREAVVADVQRGRKTKDKGKKVGAEDFED